MANGRELFIEAMKEDRPCDYIASNYTLMSMEDMRDIILEVFGVAHSYFKDTEDYKFMMVDVAYWLADKWDMEPPTIYEGAFEED